MQVSPGNATEDVIVRVGLGLDVGGARPLDPPDEEGAQVARGYPAEERFQLTPADPPPPVLGHERPERREEPVVADLPAQHVKDHGSLVVADRVVALIGLSLELHDRIVLIGRDVHGVAQ